MIDIAMDKVEATLWMSLHPWTNRRIWCGLIEKMGTMKLITHPLPSDNTNDSICEVELMTRK